MTTEQVLIRLPEDLMRRFKRAVPTRARSAFVRHLLEGALPPDDGDQDTLYLTALAVERDTVLTEEMAVWDTQPHSPMA
jgi:metal-responsive CopG/Arc/MetJ family transcriptional regulator